MKDEFKNEGFVAQACGKPTFAQRMREAGLGDLLALEGAPRKRIKVIAQSGGHAMDLLDEGGQRAMLHAIAKSLRLTVQGYDVGQRSATQWAPASTSLRPNRW